ncbi:Crp/Fnr family transcriptional regulator [Reyranella sp.]|uniref:Crp/Fnr family transcriptional regulator n=1 Tax=Reyranella sp. TaxID=1929291 RepID=UPI0040371114
MTRVARKISSGRWDSPIVARLRQFVDLGTADLDALRALIEGELNVGRRRDLVVEGYEYSKLSFVKEGFAARYKLLRNGKRQIINVVVPGDVIGLPGSFLDQATFSVIALTDIKLEVCSLDGFFVACHRQPKFGLILTWLAVQEAMSYADRIVDIGRRTPAERLAHFLLEIHGRLALVGCATEASFDLPISQEVISDALGLSVPHLNRMLAKLRGEGLIAIADRRIQFIDKKALHLLAHFQPARLARIPAALPIKHGLIA